jgi:hypothetical protein
MTDDELKVVAKQWVAYQQTKMRSPEELELRPTRRNWSRLVHEDPESLWKLILAILRTDDSLRTDQMLAAGEIENLLCKDGPAFIDRVEAQAKQDSRFAKILGGTWGWTRMSPEVWTRVCAARDQKAWDRIHEGIIDEVPLHDRANSTSE